MEGISLWYFVQNVSNPWAHHLERGVAPLALPADYTENRDLGVRGVLGKGKEGFMSFGKGRKEWIWR